VTLAIERYDDGVVRLRMQSIAGRLTGYDVSAYVVRGTLVDTGFHRARGAMRRAIETLGVRGAIVTHWHEDHAGNVELLASRKLPLLLRKETEEILRRRPGIRLYRRSVWGHPPPLRSAVIPFDAEDLEVIHTPGHSPDHQVVWDASTDTLFTGDLWLGVKSRLMHASEDPYEIVESLRRVLALRPVRLFDAHRGPIANAVTALQARIDWLTETIGAIDRRIAEGWGDRAIVRDVLGGEERAAVYSGGEYARRNLVRAVRKGVESGHLKPDI
jgi:glyoxylase-like metal-dependent hydrolase (beta-lactamase superfamily II)